MQDFRGGGFQVGDTRRDFTPNGFENLGPVGDQSASNQNELGVERVNEVGDEPGLRELFEAADMGDSLARRLADQLTCEFGVLIANLIYALDPELILVGGGLIARRPDVLDTIRREALTRIAYLPPGAPEILPMALGDAAGVLGGVALAIDTIAQTK